MAAGCMDMVWSGGLLGDIGRLRVTLDDFGITHGWLPGHFRYRMDFRKLIDSLLGFNGFTKLWSQPEGALERL